jgi:hypothetical protein
MLDGTLYPFLVIIVQVIKFSALYASGHPDFGVCFVLTNDWFYRFFRLMESEIVLVY